MKKLIGFFVYVIIALFLSIILIGLGEYIDKLGLPPLPSTACIVLFVMFLQKFYHHRPIKELGISQDLQDLQNFWYGLGIFFIMLLIVFGVEILQKWAEISYINTSKSDIQTIMIAFVTALFTAIREEILFRGYVLNFFADRYKTWFGIITSSAIFGCLHLFKPDATLGYAIYGILSGLLYGCAFIKRKNLWVAIGLHTGNNFLFSSIFGYPSPDNPNPISLITQITLQHNLWTGHIFSERLGLNFIFMLLIGFFLLKLGNSETKQTNQ
jgi:uncharacterized protein